jgi:hypothetical protein
MRSTHLLAFSLTLAVPRLAPGHGTTDREPPHLKAARAIVKNLQLENTTYEHGQPDVTFTAPYKCHADCSGFLDALLRHSYGYTAAQFKQWFGQERPTADCYHDAILKGELFDEIKDFKQVRPGDILAVKYQEPKEKSTGHLMLVAGPPKRLAAKDPVQAGTEQWEVPVVDSAKSGHSKSDTRHGKGAGAKDHDGLGEGVLRVYTDGGGTIVGYTWSVTGKSFLGQQENHMVVGRLKAKLEP